MVRVDVGAADLIEIRRAGQAVAAWVRRIDDAFGQASIIVAVRSALPIDAILVAQSLTGAGGLQRRPAPAPSWSVHSRVRPGSGSGAPTLSGINALGELVAGLNAAAAGRGVPLPAVLRSVETDDWPAVLPAARSGDRSAPAPDGAADTILDNLEADPGAHDHADEALLCAVRDFRPDLYPALLDRYARRRTGPGWGVSLALAAQFRQDLAVWRAAADGAGRDPGRMEDWPPTRFGTGPADAVVLALAADAPTAEPGGAMDESIARWRRLGTSPQADEALAFLRPASSVRPSPGTIHPSAATVALLARAGFRHGQDTSAWDWQDDATWIALANSAGTSTLAADLNALRRADQADLAFATVGLIPLRQMRTPRSANGLPNGDRSSTSTRNGHPHDLHLVLLLLHGDAAQGDPGVPHGHRGAAGSMVG